MWTFHHQAFEIGIVFLCFKAFIISKETFKEMLYIYKNKIIENYGSKRKQQLVVNKQRIITVNYEQFRNFTTVFLQQSFYRQHHYDKLAATSHQLHQRPWITIII